MEQTLVFWLENIAAGLFLWFGLYIMTRDLLSRDDAELPERWWWLRQPALWASLAMILTSWFFFGVAVRTMAPTAAEYVLWLRRTWGGMPIAIVFWFWVVIFLCTEASQRRNYRVRKLVIFLVIPLIAAFLSVAGTFTDFLQRFQDTREVASFERFYIPPNMPAYYIYFVFFLGILSVSAVLLTIQYRKTRGDSRRQEGFKWLSSGAWFIVAGAMTTLLGYVFLQGRVPEQWGDLIATIGLVLAGVGIVNYGAIVRNQIFKEDFIHSLVGVAAVTAFYVIAFQAVHWIGGYDFSDVSISLLILLAILTHSLFDWGRGLLDRVFLPQSLTGYRQQLIQLRREILLAPNQQEALASAEKEFAQTAKEARESGTREMIKDETKRIFKYAGFRKDDVLAGSKLFDLEIVQQALMSFVRTRRLSLSTVTKQDKAETLRGFLIDCIEKLCPDSHTESQPPSDEWFEYCILHLKYVEDSSRDEVEKHFRDRGHVVAGGTYGRYLEKARERLATIIWQMEMQERKRDR